MEEKQNKVSIVALIFYSTIVLLLGGFLGYTITKTIQQSSIIISANCITSEKIDVSVFDNRNIRVINAEKKGDYLKLKNAIYSDIGVIYFMEDQDISNIDVGDTFTFNGWVYLDKNTNEVYFRNAKLESGDY